MTARNGPRPPTAGPGRGFTLAANGSERWAGQGVRVTGKPRAPVPAAFCWAVVCCGCCSKSLLPPLLALVPSANTGGGWSPPRGKTPMAGFPSYFPGRALEARLASLLARWRGALERALAELGWKKLN